ncbi:MAG: hypothetical protein Q7J34_12075 [Bacteroidales bacterium]|nr:hypothetical protein [Bacteroidales bacterium]
MKTKINWNRVIYNIGVIALIVGSLDPLEGSMVIAAGSACLAFSTQLLKDRHKKIFLTTFTAIAFGVCALFYLSSLGGFGGTSNISWWWGAFILPYPIGWFITIVLLIIRAFNKNNSK